MSLTPSHIIQHQYCPRFTWFEFVLRIPQYEERHFKIQKGRQLHQKRLEENREYLRRRLGVVEKYLDQYLTDGDLRGRLDEALLLADGSMAPLDYKFAEYKGKVFSTYKLQLACYAVLIEANFGKPVNKGYLCYTRSKHKVIEVAITDGAKTAIKESVRDIMQIIEKNFYPKATKYKSRCITCTYRNICTQ